MLRKQKQERDNLMTNFSSAVKSHATKVSARNQSKVAKIASRAADASVIAMLTECNVSAARFAERALYATEKAVNITHVVTRETSVASDVNANMNATLRTLLNASRADVTVTKADIEAALSKDINVAKEKKNIVFQRNQIMSANTLAAQSQQCVDVIKTLNIVKETERNVFTVDIENAILAAFETKFVAQTKAA